MSFKDQTVDIKVADSVNKLNSKINTISIERQLATTNAKRKEEIDIIREKLLEELKTYMNLNKAN